jgi:hypothetical protein
MGHTGGRLYPFDVYVEWNTCRNEEDAHWYVETSTTGRNTLEHVETNVLCFELK